MKLTIIGCTGSMSGPNAPASCYLVQEKIGERTYSLVLDMGPGSFGHLYRYINPEDIDGIIISHWHADHCSDMVSMHVYRRWHPHKKFSQLDVYSPGKGIDRLRQLDGSADKDNFSEFKFHDFCGYAGERPGQMISIGPWLITPYEACHTVPALSLRIESRFSHAVMTYTGDTDMCSGLCQAAHHADLLLSEAGFSDKQSIRGVHLSGVRAGQLAQQAGVSRLVLTHIQLWTPPHEIFQEARRTFSGDIDIAQAGNEYTINPSYRN